MKKKWKLCRTITFFWLTMPSFVFGQSSGKEPDNFFALDLSELRNIVVTVASTKEESIPETPAIVSRYDRNEMARIGLTTLKDILAIVPGIVMPGAPLGNQPVMIRGLVDGFNQKVLFLIDDVPYWMPSHSDFPILGIPIEAIEHIEVIRGPGSVFYGTNAAAGVIKIVTRKDSGNTLALSGSSNKLIQGGGYVSHTINDNNHVSLAVDKQEDGGYNGDFEGMLIPPNYPANTPSSVQSTHSESANSFLAQYSNPNLHLMAQGFDSTVESLSGPASAINPGHIDSKGFLFGGDYIWHLDKAELKLFSDYNRYYPEYYADNFLGGVSNGYAQFDNSGRDNFRWRNGFGLDYELSKQLKLSVGAEHEKRSSGTYNIHSETTDTVVSMVYQGDDLGESSGYAQLDYILSVWRFLLGVRYVDNEKSGSDIMPRIAGIYKIDNQQSIKMLYSVGFNSPNFFQLGANTSGIISSSEDLVAETVNSLDLAYTYATAKQLFVANIYYLTAEDSIQRRRINGVINYFNGEKFNRYGTEVDYKYNVNNWTILSNMSYNHQGNKHIDEDNLSILVPRFTANLGTSYHFSENQSFGGSIQYLSQRARADALTIANINYRYIFNNYELSATVKNLTDERIMNPDVANSNENGLVPGGDGINFLLGLKYNF